jgi:hypothetical protein
VIFSGSGYQSGETVAMGLNDGTSLGTVAADPSGSFTEPVVIPASTRPGTYQVMATGADQQLTSTLEVTPATAVAGETRSAVQASRGSSLPFTGAVVVPLLALAAALLAAGAFMLRAARRRSSTN